MKIFATGDVTQLEELAEKISDEHDFDYEESTYPENIPFDELKDYDMIFMMRPEYWVDNDLFKYTELENKIVVVDAVRRTLSFIYQQERANVTCHLIGMNLIHTFIGRPKSEVSFLRKTDKEVFDSAAKLLHWDYVEVEDRVGMVTPRVVFQIINEACFTLQEGTATMQDIDKAMKLGTNYPYGPFEWCDLIGVKDVYEVLCELWRDTRDERFKICPLLKTKWLLGEKFYQ